MRSKRKYIVHSAFRGGNLVIFTKKDPTARIPFIQFFTRGDTVHTGIAISLPRTRRIVLDEELNLDHIVSGFARTYSEFLAIEALGGINGKNTSVVLHNLSLNNIECANYNFFRVLAMSEECAKDAKEFIYSAIGASYDYRGAINVGFVKWLRTQGWLNKFGLADNKHKYFCSELVAQTLHLHNPLLYDELNLSKSYNLISPQDISDKLQPYKVEV